jgi:hypothetical protein
LRKYVLLAIPAIALILDMDGESAQRNLLRPVCDARFWSFDRVLGGGAATIDKTECAVRVESALPEGMAASWKSSKFAVEPNRRYTVSMEVRTEGLQPTTATLTGAPYVLFWDSRLLPGGYQPITGMLAPRDSEWHAVTQTVTSPTTARTAEVYLAYAAFGGYEGGKYPRESGRAHGKVWMRNVSVLPADKVSVPPSTMHVSDPTVQAALETVAGCLHNTSLNGRFTPGDGYTLSENIVPDLSFGLFGVRRLAYPEYMEKFQRFWEKVGAGFGPDGKAEQRVMSHVLFPLGVDEVYSFTGDQTFLDRMLPIADRSFDYLKQRADPNGLVRLVEYGQWHIGQGADWVDWYKTRMEGKTFNFHQWYVRSLRRTSELHRELASRGVAGSHAERAREYLERAAAIEASLRKLYWRDGYFVTNIDFGGQVADEKWLDDQVWSVRLGIATPEMAKKIWASIDASPFFYEGVPTRWTAFTGPVHGPLTWFGRLGAGDILARYSSGNPARGFELLQRMGEIFARDGNVYEAYDMYGDIVPGTKGWGNYTEHCGGYIWAVAGGPFGTDFDSDAQAAATIKPQFPEGMTSASGDFYLRSTRFSMVYSLAGEKGQLTLSANGRPQPVRVRLPDGREEIVRLETGFKKNWTWVAQKVER